MKVKYGTPIAIGLFVISSIIIGFLVFILPIPNSADTEHKEFDIDEAIQELQSEHQQEWPYVKYSIRQTDWNVYSRMAEDSRSILTRMDNWEEFEESLKLSSYTTAIYVDRENKVVWYNPVGTINVIYWEYD